jgi:hypothetical protein
MLLHSCESLNKREGDIEIQHLWRGNCHSVPREFLFLVLGELQEPGFKHRLILLKAKIEVIDLDAQRSFGIIKCLALLNVLLQYAHFLK